MQKAFITGGAGFIGSTLADRLSAEGIGVVIYDDLSRGRSEFIAAACARPEVEFVHGDVLDEELVRLPRRAANTVFHSRDAEVLMGASIRAEISSRTDREPLLKRCAPRGTARFASTGRLRGAEVSLRRDVPLPVQTSLYGASKCRLSLSRLRHGTASWA